MSLPSDPLQSAPPPASTLRPGVVPAPAQPGDDHLLAPLSLLHTLLAQLAVTSEGPLTAELVITLVARAVQASAGAVGRCTDDGQAIEILASSGYAPGMLDRWARLPLAAALPLPDVVRAGNALFLSTADELLGRYPQLASAPLEHRAWALAPLIVGERVIGGLILGFATPRPFAPADQLLITIVAQICAQALERARLAEIEHEAREITAATISQISRAHARTQQLQQVTAALSEVHTPSEVAAVIVREGLATTGMHAGVVYALSDGGQAFVALADAGYPAALWPQYLPGGGIQPSLVAEAVRRRDVVAVSTAAELVDRWPHLATDPARSGDEATLAVPLLADGQVLGVIELASRTPHSWTPDDLAFIRTLGHLCGQALQRANLYAAEQASRQAAERAAERTARLQAVTASLSTALTMTDVAQVIVAQGAAALGAYAGILVRCHDQQPLLELVTSQGYSFSAWGGGTTLPLDAPMPIADAARTGSDIWLRDLAEYATHYPHLVGLPQRSTAVAALPLRSAGQLIGAIGFSFATPQRFTADDQAFAVTLAEHGAQALERARLHRVEAERRATAEAAQSRSRLLAEVSQALAMAQPDFTAVLGQVLRQMGERFADSCGVRLLSEDGRELHAAGTYHRDPDAQVWLEQLNATPIPIAVGAVAQVARSGDPLFLPVVDADTRAAVTDPSYASYLRRFPFWSLMVVPLRARGRVLGTVKVTRSTPDQPFTPDDLQLLVDLADRAALAIDNAQLYASLQQAHAVAEATAERIGRLQWLTAALADALTPQDVARVAVNDGTAVLGAQAGMIALIADDGASLEMVSSTGEREALAHPGPRVALDAPLPSSEAVRTGQLILTSSRAELIARYPQLADRQWATFESRAAIPLRSEREPLGVLLLSFAGSRRFSAEEQDLMLLIGRQCAQALERARLYAREHQARAEAEAAVRAREQFLSIAAHELKTPLTPLLGQAQRLERRAQRADQLSENDRRALRVIASQAQRLDQLVRSMLDLTRLQTGRLTLRRVPLDLRDLARRLADELQPTLERHQLTLELPDEPAMVDGDWLRLEQVLLNLLQNAMKYSPAGGPLRLRLDLERDHVVLTVQDWGIGIPAEALPRLFEPFFRAANAELHVLPGMGVGLAVVKEVVTLHGGTVAASSVEGQGSTFTITLPRATHAAVELGRRP